jgi:hypothetical protein
LFFNVLPMSIYEELFVTFLVAYHTDVFWDLYLLSFSLKTCIIYAVEEVTLLCALRSMCDCSIDYAVALDAFSVIVN